MGRNLDAQVAEKVMGMKMNGSELPIIWEPSRSIRDAWDVVEKLTRGGFHFLLLKSADSGLSIATFYLGPHDRNDGSRTDVSAPIAICRAALAAMHPQASEGGEGG